VPLSARWRWSPASTIAGTAVVTSIIATPATITKATIAATTSVPTVAHATLHRGTTTGTAHSTAGNSMAATYPAPPRSINDSLHATGS
jgi:hypothetical protein